MRSLAVFIIFTLFIVVMDLYALRGIRTLTGSAAGPLFLWFWFGATVAFLAVLVWAGSVFQRSRDLSLFFSVMVVMGIFLMLYVPKLIFNLIQLAGDVVHLATGIFGGTGRSFRNWFLVPGAVAGLLLAAAFGMGMLHGRTNIKVFKPQLKITGLPVNFDGLKIVQLSDIHLAGFYRFRDHMERVVTEVNSLEPDLILFTGDMVHNFAEEMDPFIGILKGLEAPLGKFAVLGNHDYGHYYNWDSTQAEMENLEQVKARIRAAGFDLLLNEHRSISLNGDSITILGVENWGKPPFPQLGDLDKAMEGTAPDQIRILLSHDPSHWDLQVRGREQIALTLSGHTHGMQFGFELGRFRWSPSKWTYKQWAGLYKENGQYLYVNRGLGYTGYPGRVGIRPEITLLTLEAGTSRSH